MGLARLRIATDLLASFLQHGTDAADPVEPEADVKILRARMSDDGRTLELIVERPSMPELHLAEPVPDWAPIFQRRVLP